MLPGIGNFEIVIKITVKRGCPRKSIVRLALSDPVYKITRVLASVLPNTEIVVHCIPKLFIRFSGILANTLDYAMLKMSSFWIAMKDLIEDWFNDLV